MGGFLCLKLIPGTYYAAYFKPIALQAPKNGKCGFPVSEIRWSLSAEKYLITLPWQP
jgi:hypothetical protein